MSVGDSIRKNMTFWHWYPQLICKDLTDEQLHWQPENNPNHMMFALWHAYRSEDNIIHGLLIGKPPVFYRDGWEKRLPVAEPGNPPIGTGLKREQIARVHLPLDAIIEYAEAVGNAVQEYADTLSEEEGAVDVPLPFFEGVYPLTSASRAEVLTFFSIGHVCEHLGEVQYIKGMLGMQGAPL